MKSILVLAAIAATASLVTFGASAQSLLGLNLDNIVGGQSGQGLASVSTTGGNTSVGLLGTNVVTLRTGGNSVGVPGVLEVSGTPNSGGGSSVGISVLGGTPQGTTNPLGLLGNGGGIGIGLPGLGGLTGGGNGGGGNGGNGGNGGTPIINVYANNGGSTFTGGNGGNGGSFTVPSNISSRMQTLLRALAARNYLRLANGKAVCLTSFNVAEVGGWIPQKDWGVMQQTLGSYAQDIYTLRQLLANCRSATQRQALNLTDLKRVIAIDIKNGQPLLYLL
jgi:hypothetical protein